MELQPESDAQPAIRPTQLIVHSLAAPWTIERIYAFWRDGTNLESHFGVGYDGRIGQYIGTQTRADANAAANLRADGSGALSVETASNVEASDPWTAAQVESLIRLGVWAHQQHGIPLRLCRSASDPGFGWHRQFDAWNPNAHSCPGDARIRQFRDVIFPEIVARATGKTTTTEPQHPQENDGMTLGKLNEANPLDVTLKSGEWTRLAFEDAVLHSGPRRLVGPTYVQLTFAADTPPGTLVTGRFYATDTSGKDESGYGDVGPLPLQAGGAVQFLHNVDVPAERHLRFMVRAVSPDGAPVTLTHRFVTGDYVA
ncbi:peptidoglycan recognition protein family protein [Streptomyces longwoodensis]|nr:peptidoglycan recognition family protein [Streptomyces longwoodensis]